MLSHGGVHILMRLLEFDMQVCGVVIRRENQELGGWLAARQGFKPGEELGEGGVIQAQAL